MQRPNLYGLLKEKFGTHQYVAIGDTNHVDTDLQAMLNDPDLLKAAALSGAKSLVLEMDKRFSAEADLIKRGIDDGIERDAFEKSFYDSGYNVDSLKSLFDAAVEGLDPVVPDERYELLDTTPGMSEALDNIYAVFELSPDEACNDVFLQSHFKKLPAEADFIESIIDTGDVKIAGNIQAEVGNNKALIIYGAGHFDGENDLNELLGEDKVVVIAAISSREKGFNFDGGVSEDGKVADPPDYIYIADEDAVIPFDPDSPEVKQILANYQSTDHDRIPKGKYLECLGELPDDLKSHAPERPDVTRPEMNNALGLK